MLDADVQKRLWLVGLGGQNAFRTDTGDHLMVRNIVHEKDIVPKVPNQPVNVLRKPRIEKFSNKDVGLPEGVNEGLVSSHVLHNGGYYRYLQKSPLPPEMMR